MAANDQAASNNHRPPQYDSWWLIAGAIGFLLGTLVATRKLPASPLEPEPFVSEQARTPHHAEKGSLAEPPSVAPTPQLTSVQPNVLNDTSPERTFAQEPGPHFEPSDVDVRGIFLVVLVMSLVHVALLVVVLGTHGWRPQFAAALTRPKHDYPLRREPHLDEWEQTRHGPSSVLDEWEQQNEMRLESSEPASASQEQQLSIEKAIDQFARQQSAEAPQPVPTAKKPAESAP